MGSCCLQWSSWIVCCLIIILFNVLSLRHWGGSSIHWVQQIPESLCIRCENIKRVICFVTYARRRGAWRRHRWRWKHKPMDKLVLLASLTAAADGGQMAGVVPNPSRLDQRAMIKFCRGWRMSTSKHSPVMLAVYGERCLSKTTVKDCTRLFREGQQLSNDLPRPGQAHVVVREAYSSDLLSRDFHLFEIFNKTVKMIPMRCAMGTSRPNSSFSNQSPSSWADFLVYPNREMNVWLPMATPSDDSKLLVS